LFNGNRTVTLHDDCIFEGGPDSLDAGTFPSDNRTYWVEYTQQVASGNTFGGEPCADAGDPAAFNWSDWTTLCGYNGLIPYINTFEISYLNVSTSLSTRLKYLIDYSLIHLRSFKACLRTQVRVSAPTQYSKHSSSGARRIFYGEMIDL